MIVKTKQQSKLFHRHPLFITKVGGIHRSDVYSAYSVLSKIIAPILKEYRNTIANHFPSCPMYCVDAYPNDDNKAVDLWLTDLDKMIWAFTELHNENAEDAFFTKNDKKNYHLQKGDLIEFLSQEQYDTLSDEEKTQCTESPFPSFDIDKEGMNIHYQKIQEGLNLFAEHFQDLWY